MDLLDVMLDHDRWATEQVLAVSAGLSDSQLDQSFDIGHQTLRATFAHMIFNLPFWTAFLEGASGYNGYSSDNPPDNLSIASLSEHHARFHDRFATSARQMRDEDRLGETYTDHWNVRKSAGGTILMVIEHNAEHRSEALHILNRLGVPELPEIDLGVWDYLLHNE